MNRIISLFFIVFMSLGPALFGQEKIQWMTFEEAQEKMETEKKMILVDMYTNWCGWCKKMDKETFQEEAIAKYVNENFYPVKFNAETQTPIEFNGKTFEYVKSGRKGYNQLAAELSRGLGRLSFPTVVFIDRDYQVIQAIATYMGPEDFRIVATFFAENHYKKTPWKRYYQSCKVSNP